MGEKWKQTTNIQTCIIFNLENQQQDDEKYIKQTVIDTLYVKDLLEMYSMQSDLIIMWVYKFTLYSGYLRVFN